VDLLSGIDGLRYENFEVCVVEGPTQDGTSDFLASLDGRIKRVRCFERNLSKSRNLGIALASGDVVAFIDDDAVPEPEWLDELLSPYSDATVGGAGGFVLDPGGISYQYRFGIADRLGNCSLRPSTPMPELCFPFTANYPHLLGTNCSFRRETLLDIGGFDEEYEYYLDETDLCCRITDAGWRLVQVPGARVHHRYAESALRTDRRVLRGWYSVIKSKIYFSLVNGTRHHEVRFAVEDAERLIARLEADLRWAIHNGFLDDGDAARFRLEADRAFADGLKRGLAGQRRLPSFERLRASPPFRPFKPRARAPCRSLVLLSREYPPDQVGGIGQYTANLAQAAAELGYPVRVITRAVKDEESVTYHKGVWIHRVVPKAPVHPSEPAAHALAYARRAADEVTSISVRHGVGMLCAPIWDAEGVMVVRDGRIPVVTTLHTPLSVWLESSTLDGARLSAPEGFVSTMLDLEREVLQGSQGIIANSAAILTAMHDNLSRPFNEGRLKIIPHGLKDLREMPRVTPQVDASLEGLRILCVARLEPRKGVDVLLEAALTELATRPTVFLDLIGDDSIRLEDGTTMRERFEMRNLDTALRRRIRFHGQVGESEMYGLLASADVVVVPSRFESFGLTALEAMIFGKPLVCSRTGGLIEVVEEGQTALLAEPGDVRSLGTELGRLLDDPNLRRSLGENGRRRYEQFFTAQIMAERVISFAATLDGGPMRRETSL
jgi:glycosyltransferase involved in cell wall biosynthesis/GT2 family glycosyltransferase